jgi:hypothetical protein
MTMIRLDAATLAKFQSGTGPFVLCKEDGSPVLECAVHQLENGEPVYSPEQLRKIRDQSPRYPLDEIWSMIRAGEAM